MRAWESAVSAFVLLLALTAGAACPRAVAADSIIERVAQDVDGDGKADRIVLSLGHGPGDPGEFDHIALNLSASGKRFVFRIDDGWVRFDGKDSDSPANSMRNLLSSHRLLLVKDAEGDQLLMAFGFPYGCCDRQLTVIRIGAAGAKRVLEREMRLESIGDLDGDGRTDLVGSFTTEALGVRCHGYQPDAVYTLGANFRFNRRLTERHDRKQDGFYAADGQSYVVLEGPAGRKSLHRESERIPCD